MKTTITILVMLVLSVSGFSQTLTNRVTDIPFSAIIQGTCENEPVALVGVISSNQRRSTAIDGITKVEGKEMLKGEGTGLLTGTKYNLSSKTSSRLFFSSEGVISVSWINKLTLVGPGPDNDMFITYVIKQVGDEIVVNDFRGVCK